MKKYFERKAEKRKEFNNDLHRHMVNEYDEFDDDSSFTGSKHCPWMDIKALFFGDGDEAILEESIRGVKAVVDEYSDVLDDNNLPVNSAQLIREQKNDIESDLLQNKNMEDIRA